jgi:proline dehydrogenase
MKRMFMRLGFARRAARRFIAGESSEECITTARSLIQRGFPVTLNQLGESVTGEADAVQATDGYLDALDRIAENGIQAGISVKLTQLGLDLNQGLCASNLGRIAAKAKSPDTFLAIDMESSEYVDRTLALCRDLHPKFDSLRVCIQSYLYRSEEDTRQLIAEGANIRLVKGTYKEPSDIAFSNKRDVDASLVKLMQMVLWATAEAGDGRRPFLSMASHDDKIVEATKAFAAELGLPKDAYEFQMLHGIRRDLQQQLLEEGYVMRVYLPYGTEWYPYFMRRLAERPANVWFLVGNLLRG